MDISIQPAAQAPNLNPLLIHPLTSIPRATQPSRIEPDSAQCSASLVRAIIPLAGTEMDPQSLLLPPTVPLQLVFLSLLVDLQKTKAGSHHASLYGSLVASIPLGHP